MAMFKVGEEKGANKDNFFLVSTANFAKVAMPEGSPDFVSSSGSAYWYSADGVIRVADHWGSVATCTWTLDGEITKKRFSRKTGRLEIVKTQRKIRAGFCAWNNFTRAICEELAQDAA